jgi:hypothetical protein
MTIKSLIRPDRVRRVPRQFNWVDGRLVRDGYLDRCSHPAAALYLFLLTVGDSQGLSYYSDTSMAQRLRMDLSALVQARLELIQLGLVAHRKPFYQVLDLCQAPAVTLPRNQPGDPPMAIGRILATIMEQCHD